MCKIRIFIKSNDGSFTYFKFNNKGSDLAYKNVVAKTAKVDNLLVEVTGIIENNTILVSSISEK